MVVDIITYNGEKELFDLRYNILKDYVDEFIVVEFDKTFSGKDKPWYFKEIERKYNKICYCQVFEYDYIKYKKLAEFSPNTQGAEHWKREFMQKESIKDCLTHLEDDDIAFIGDCDEIVDPIYYYRDFEGITKFKLRVYAYYLNNRSNEGFWGTIRVKYKDIKNKCLNHLRNNNEKRNTIELCGWHFTSMGGIKNVEKKLTDSYTGESYATKEILGNLEKNITENKDFLGRNFKYQIDESDWPQYLKNNKEKYKHLCR